MTISNLIQILTDKIRIWNKNKFSIPSIIWYLYLLSSTYYSPLHLPSLLLGLTVFFTNSLQVYLVYFLLLQPPLH